MCSIIPSLPDGPAEFEKQPVQFQHFRQIADRFRENLKKVS